MRFYKATQKVRLPAAVILALTIDQIRRRKHLLLVAEDGMVVTKAPVEFKAGEIIGFEQEPRAQLPMLEPLEYDDDGDGEMLGEGTVGGEANSGSVGADAKDEACADGIEKLQAVVYAKLGRPGDAEEADESAEAAKTDLPVDAEKADGSAEDAVDNDAGKAEAEKADGSAEAAKTEGPVDTAKSAKKPK